MGCCRSLVGEGAPRGCTRDGGRSLGVGLQEQAPNHLKLLWSNARVVSVKEKALRKVSGEVQGGERKRTTGEVSKTSIGDVETGDFHYTRKSPGGTCILSGRRPA
jgi:hypothetical protein